MQPCFPIFVNKLFRSSLLRSHLPARLGGMRGAFESAAPACGSWACLRFRQSPSAPMPLSFLLPGFLKPLTRPRAFRRAPARGRTKTRPDEFFSPFGSLFRQSGSLLPSFASLCLPFSPSWPPFGRLLPPLLPCPRPQALFLPFFLRILGLRCPPHTLSDWKKTNDSVCSHVFIISPFHDQFLFIFSSF